MRKIRNADNAVVGIVVTVLLIGLALAVSVMINTVYVPRWTEETEAAHMDEVANQFAQLKYALDVQSVAKQTTAISASITLGSQDIPILGLGNNFGSLQILENQCNITIQSESGSPHSESIGMIKYSSGNSYFVQQDYVYQGGALILSQPPRSMLIGKPSFVVTDYTNISFTIINISTTEGKNFASGDGTYPIHTEYIGCNIDSIANVTNITVITNYPNAWKIAFESTLRQSDNPFSSDYVTMSGDKVTVEFPSGAVNSFTFQEIKVFAQIAPGWIE
jgi:hypothetical protein